MDLSDFDYQIPENQIAQYPLKKRDTSRLFVLHKKTGHCEHRLFKDMVHYLSPGDVLVLNNTRVIPVRIPGIKPTGGKVEITLLKEFSVNSWEALVKGMHEGKVLFEYGISAQVSRLNGKMARVDFAVPPDVPRRKQPDIKSFLHDIGVMPLPVYIKRETVKSDSRHYQTVYAEKDGAVAAPTAGLHFTDRLIHSIKEKGIHVRKITLHVGYGTFKPVTVKDVREHAMDEEPFEIPASTAAAINAAKAEGRRVIAVGTTVTRALETAATPSLPPLVNGDKGGVNIKSGSGQASLFIYPGYQFHVVDALITNFHLPKSTPMMLASAFSGLSDLKRAYSIAHSEGYRFYSFGDAMLISK